MEFQIIGIVDAKIQPYIDDSIELMNFTMQTTTVAMRFVVDATIILYL